jgi:hypothetical protein
MSNTPLTTFIIDCPECKAKVAAVAHGEVRTRGGVDEEGDEHYGQCLAIGQCPKCRCLLAGASQQVGIENYDSYRDEWGDFVRVYPKPRRTFVSNRIPSLVTDSVTEADKALQANANTAACVMLDAHWKPCVAIY